MATINCHQYDAPIAIILKQEKVLVHEANNTVKRGTLMVIAAKYMHLNSKLGAEIQYQQDCYIVNKEDSKTDKYWKYYPMNGYGELP